ncbi:MAG: hypothetical protein KY437_04315 [Actinobacteria bacterium]|nr:hypothetical protein [Actinomycetota bacterium]
MADDLDSRLSTQLPAVFPAAVFTAGAGVVHLAAAVPHFADSVLLGSGFVAVGWAQLAAAALLLRRRQDRTVRWSVVALNAVAVAAWALSRTVGLPVGHPGPEAVGLADALTVALEVLAVGLFVWRSRLAPEKLPRWRRAVVLASTWTLVVGGSTLAIADVGTHGHQGAAEEGHGLHASADELDHVTAPDPSRSSATAPATRAMADDIAPRSWPGADQEAPSTGPEPDHDDTDDAAHTHAPGEGH